MMRAAIGSVVGVPNLLAQGRAVTINVLVLEPRGRYVAGLDRSNFRVFEDDVEQTIDVSWAKTPGSLGMVVNVHGAALQSIRKSNAEFSRMLLPEDDFFVSYPQGPLFDAVYNAVTRLKQSRNHRKILYVVSDQADSSSRHTAAEISQALRDSTAQIFAAGSPDQPDGTALQAMADTTGGRYFTRLDGNELNAQALGLIIRSSHELTYTPRNQARDGGFRRISGCRGNRVAAAHCAYQTGIFCSCAVNRYWPCAFLLFGGSCFGMDLDIICERIVPTLCRRQFIRFEGVGIQLQSNGGISVTEPLRNSWNRHTLTEQLRGVGVPKRM